MTEEQQAGRGGGFTKSVTKKALAPIVASAATAATAYGMQKGVEIWHGIVRPKIEEKGGVKAVANEALDGLRERLPDSALKKLDRLASRVTNPPERYDGRDATVSDGDREEERRRREQRRQQRRRAFEQAGSS